MPVRGRQGGGAVLLNGGRRRPALAALTGAALPGDLAADTAVDALIRAFVPLAYLGGPP